MNTIIDFLEKQKQDFSTKIFIKTNVQSISFEETWNKVDKLSAILNEFPKKSIISMMFDNSIEFVISYLSIIKSGRIAHIIPPLISEKNFLQQIQSSKPEIILTLDKLVKTFGSLQKEVIFVDFHDFVKKQSSLSENSVSEISSLIYTSGTTSFPKGVPIRHLNTIFTTENIVNVLGYNNSDIDVIPLPLSHSFGLGCLHVSLYNGSTLVLHKNTMNILDILNSIKENNATTFAAVPATLTSLVNDFPEKFVESCNKLRLIITNSTRVPNETIQKIIKLLPNTKFATYYGLTEASRSTFMIFNDNLDKIKSVGKSAPGVDIKIMKENNEMEEGEVLIKGNNVIENYWNSKFNEKFSNGWLKTGDLGFLDDEGFLYLKGRKDNVINVAGEKVNPEEIENIVKMLIPVEDAIAVGKDHSLFGQVVKLFVKKTKNEEIEASEIIKHCKRDLERFKVPAEVEFVIDFPKTDYGKVKRFMLRGDNYGKNGKRI